MPPNQAADSAVGPLGYLTPKTIDKARDGAVVRFKQHRSTRVMSQSSYMLPSRMKPSASSSWRLRKRSLTEASA